MIQEYHLFILYLVMNSSGDLLFFRMLWVTNPSCSTDSPRMIETSSIDGDDRPRCNSSTSNAPSIASGSSHNETYSSEEIKNLLLSKKQKYQIFK